MRVPALLRGRSLPSSHPLTALFSFISSHTRQVASVVCFGTAADYCANSNNCGDNSRLEFTLAAGIISAFLTFCWLIMRFAAGIELSALVRAEASGAVLTSNRSDLLFHFEHGTPELNVPAPLSCPD
jgi:hypothetical protein